MSSFLLLSLLATAQPSQVETPAATCKFFLYPVGENGRVGDFPIITPNQVSSQDFQATDAMPGFKRWRITLTPAGASANEAYSKEHLGGKIAVFCGSKEVTRATIAGQSSDTFVIDLADKSP